MSPLDRDADREGDEMSFFFMKLVPPRASFPGDASEEELAAMGQHADYIRGLIAEDIVICAGPVMDPAASWGAAIAEVDSLEEALALGRKDPVVLAELGFRWEAWPMGALLRKAP